MAKSRLIIIGIALLVILFFALLFSGIIPGLKKNGGKAQVTSLTFWGVFDGKQKVGEALAGIPGFQVTYREMNPATYEADLINALASGKGPDIFMVHNTWLPKHSDKLRATTLENLGIGKLRDVFPAVVEQDFGPDSGLVYALPLYIDTLALLYNQDLFDEHAIALPPKTWTDFQNIIGELRQLDSTGKILKAASAIGGSNKNISRASDLLGALMLQSGVKMVNPDFSSAAFASQAGIDALKFYTKFANPGSDFYTWSPNFKNSLDSFAEESTAMIFDYAYQIPLIQQKNPFLKIGIAPLPQPTTATGAVNYASYWGVGVSNRFANPSAAWNFIKALTLDQSGAKLYADKTNHLPALRTLIAEKTNDSFWGTFARQALTARSWPQIDNVAVENAFSKMIDDTLSGKSLNTAIGEAQTTVSQLMAAKKNKL